MGNDFLARQSQLILEAISTYRSGQLSLRHLVARVEGLLASIQGCQEIEQEWFDRVQSLWGRLDDCYAVLLDERKSGKHRALLEEDRRAITTILDALETELRRLKST